MHRPINDHLMSVTEFRYTHTHTDTHTHRHTHTHTHTHTQTHTHTHTNTQAKQSKVLTALQSHATWSSQDASALSRHCEPAYATSWSWARNMLASFPGRRRNGLATSASSNCYFLCLKVGSIVPIKFQNVIT